jgi:hypothetical protein
MRNQALFKALCQRFGTVKVSSDGAPMTWRLKIDHRYGEQDVEVTAGGEQYSVNCPFCGDTRGRLCISHAWLTKPHPSCPAITHTIKCYNEGCRQIYTPEFRYPFVRAVRGLELLSLIVPSTPTLPPRKVRLPEGFTSLSMLPAGHRALEFIAGKYRGFDPAYLSIAYGAGFTDFDDPEYLGATNRIIFPIMEDGNLVGWQGRSVDPANRKRWYLTPGFRKCFYNGDRISGYQVPLICEGIPAAIAAGPNALAIFGKELDDRRCEDFALRWQTAVILTDPETFVADPRGLDKNKQPRVYARELKARLDKYLKAPALLFPWPEEYLELSRRKFAGAAVSVPDPADLGLGGMAKLLQAVPPSHRGIL